MPALLVAVVAFGVAVAVTTRLTDDGDEAGPSTVIASFGGEWTAPDGHRYRIGVTPGSEVHQGSTPRGCVPEATSGRLNLTFRAVIENLSDSEAPIPEVAFGTNTTADGTVDLTITSVERANTSVEVSPLGPDRDCGDANIGGGSGTLAAGELVELTGVVGGIAQPVGQGLSLVLEIQVQSLEPGVAAPVNLLGPYPVYTVIQPPPASSGAT